MLSLPKKVDPIQIICRFKLPRKKTSLLYMIGLKHIFLNIIFNIFALGFVLQQKQILRPY